jgi:hypothetical protein
MASLTYRAMEIPSIPETIDKVRTCDLFLYAYKIFFKEKKLFADSDFLDVQYV